METVRPANKTVKITTKYYVYPVFQNYAASKSGEIINIKTKRELKPGINSRTGYTHINICDKTLNKPKAHYVHRFVWESIQGEIPNDLEINHINEIKTDNRLKNLELVTHQKNIELSKHKNIYSINIVTKEKQVFDSLTKASIELKMMFRLFLKFAIRGKILKMRNPEMMVSYTSLNLKRHRTTNVI